MTKLATNENSFVSGEPLNSNFFEFLNPFEYNLYFVNVLAVAVFFVALFSGYFASFYIAALTGGERGQLLRNNSFITRISRQIYCRNFFSKELFVTFCRNFFLV